MNRIVLRNAESDYGTENMFEECQVCRSRGFTGKKHKHFSSAYQRLVVTSRGSHEMACPVCQSVHPAAITSKRIKTFFSSSTMFGFYKDKEWTGTNGYHFEAECMGGAKLLFQRRMWSSLYGEMPINVDTHVISGINDVLQLINIPGNPSLNLAQQVEVKTEIFMERVDAWYKTVKEHAKKHNLPTPNNFSLATLIRPPQLYKFDGNKNQVHKTHNELLDSINRAIDKFNAKVRTENDEIIGKIGEKPVVQGCKWIGIHMHR